MSTFDKLVPLLVDAIPQAIASMRLSSPICIVRIYYYDTHAPCTYLSLRTISASCRAEVLASKGQDGLDHLWASGEECGDGRIEIPPAPPKSKPDKELASLFGHIYELMCEDEDEEATMIRFGKTLCKVAKKLNALDWSKVCPKTEDFVIVPADGSASFRADVEDFIDSVPAARQAVLSAHGAIPKEWLNFDPRAAKAAFEAEEAAVLKAYQIEAEAKVRPVLLEAERAQQEKMKKGEACPKCGFAFGWNGAECSHCKYRNP